MNASSRWASAGGSKPWSAASSSISARRNRSSSASASPRARLTLPSPSAASRAASAASLRHALFEQQGGDLRLGQRVEPHDLAPRDDRLELELGRRADQDQHGPRRRLLQRLQERVGRLFVQVVGVVEDRHLARAPRRLERELVAQVADHADRQLVLVLGPAGLDEVGVGAGLDLEAAGAGFAGVEVACRGGSRTEGPAPACARRCACRSPPGRRTEARAGTALARRLRPQRLDDPIMAADRVPGHAQPRFGFARTRCPGSAEASIKTIGAG